MVKGLSYEVVPTRFNCDLCLTKGCHHCESKIRFLLLCQPSARIVDSGESREKLEDLKRDIERRQEQRYL